MTNPFANLWKRNKKKWALEAAQTYKYWYCQKYNLPRHDPRLEGMTEEEFEFEYWTDYYYQILAKGGLVNIEEFESDDDVAAIVEAWERGEDPQLDLNDHGEWEEIDPGTAGGEEDGGT
ncbi:MAG: hypothetical protein ACYCX4_01745 [Bacillota bacterium]